MWLCRYENIFLLLTWFMILICSFELFYNTAWCSFCNVCSHLEYRYPGETPCLYFKSMISESSEEVHCKVHNGSELILVLLIHLHLVYSRTLQSHWSGSEWRLTSKSCDQRTQRMLYGQLVGHFRCTKWGWLKSFTKVSIKKHSIIRAAVQFYLRTDNFTLTLQ